MGVHLVSPLTSNTCIYIIIQQINCETDFVARNERFRDLVATITRATLEHLSPKLLTTTNLASCDFLMSDSILNIEGGGASIGNGTIADQVAETVGHLQEKIAVPRGLTLSCSDGLLCAHVYKNSSLKNDAEIEMGTYGTILHMTSDNSSQALTARCDLTELKMLGERICQHIVGVSPFEEDSKNTAEVLLSQRFLFDESVTVGELLQRNGVSVTRFIRYALGEKETNSWTNA